MALRIERDQGWRAAGPPEDLPISSGYLHDSSSERVLARFGESADGGHVASPADGERDRMIVRVPGRLPLIGPVGADALDHPPPAFGAPRSRELDHEEVLCRSEVV